MAKVALDENIEIVLLSGVLFSNSTSDKAVLLFACHSFGILYSIIVFTKKFRIRIGQLIGNRNKKWPTTIIENFALRQLKRESSINRVHKKLSCLFL